MNASVRDSDTLFARAIEIASPEERAHFLESACVGDPELRREVEKLVGDHFRAGTFLERPVARVVAPDAGPPGESPGTVIGPYQLTEQIGEGGFGVVFLAEQTRPVRRTVAVKVLKPGMDTRQVVARFEAERQALALMDHPNIARVLDGGETASGRPYFVMELVRGIPITEFCDENHLPVRSRVGLLVTVCQAIQHSHQKGIIHRDVKPSNVLVTPDDCRPVVKVIDFGVAKAIGRPLTEKSLFTTNAQMIGTPLYMSPEQADLNGRDVDTRTDIYALGVLLYELLTGTTPFDKDRLQVVGYDEIHRVIRGEEPPRPSTRVTMMEQAAVLSARRRSDARRLSRSLRGDLDWIVMKALEKDRDRRYETASALAADLQRYLADQPVLARPPSLCYRLGKFVRKHRGPVWAAGVILVLLVCGIIGTSLGFVRADRQRTIAEENERAAQSEKTNALAFAEAARLAQQNEAAERTKAEAAQRRAIEALQATSDEVIEQLIGARPAVGLAEKDFLENTLKRWQAFADEKGDGELARQVRTEGVFRVAYLRGKLGGSRAALDGFREAADLAGKLAADFPDVPRNRQVLALSHANRGKLLWDLGEGAGAEDAYRQALVIQEKLAADFPDPPRYRHDLAGSHCGLGSLLGGLGRPDAAEDAYRRALVIQEKLAADFPDAPQYRRELAACLNDRGILQRDLGNWVAADDSYRRAQGILEKLAADIPAVPGDRSSLAAALHNRGNLLTGQGKSADAEKAYRRALGIQEKLAAEFPAVPQYSQNLARMHHSLGHVLIRVGKHTEAETACRRALGIQEKLAADFPDVPDYRRELALSHINRGNILAVFRKGPEAEDAYRRAHDIQEKLAADFPAIPIYGIDLGGTQTNLARLLAKKRQPEPALEWYGRAISTLEGVHRQVKDNAAARRLLRDAHQERARTLDIDLQRSVEALADWDKAVQLSPEPVQPELRMRRAACGVRAGRVDAATQEADVVAKSGNAVSLFNAACVYSLAAGRADETGSALSKEACAKRAVAMLMQAVDSDPKLAERLKRDDDLQALRHRDDFKQLLAENGKKSS
jgi:serine/threonine protein kinase/tetratricopeptide (TPR) repeat protein